MMDGGPLMTFGTKGCGEIDHGAQDPQAHGGCCVETLTPGCLGFRFGKKGPRKPGRLFCWESWGGLGKEPPFLLLDTMSVLGPLS